MTNKAEPFPGERLRVYGEVLSDYLVKITFLVSLPPSR